MMYQLIHTVLSDNDTERQMMVNPLEKALVVINFVHVPQQLRHVFA